MVSVSISFYESAFCKSVFEKDFLDVFRVLVMFSLDRTSDFFLFDLLHLLYL